MGSVFHSAWFISDNYVPGPQADRVTTARHWTFEVAFDAIKEKIGNLKIFETQGVPVYKEDEALLLLLLFRLMDSARDD